MKTSPELPLLPTRLYTVHCIHSCTPTSAHICIFLLGILGMLCHGEYRGVGEVHTSGRYKDVRCRRIRLQSQRRPLLLLAVVTEQVPSFKVALVSVCLSTKSISGFRHLYRFWTFDILQSLRVLLSSFFPLFIGRSFSLFSINRRQPRSKSHSLHSICPEDGSRSGPGLRAKRCRQGHIQDSELW
jgi:hypothetical protein